MFKELDIRAKDYKLNIVGDFNYNETPVKTREGERDLTITVLSPTRIPAGTLLPAILAIPGGGWQMADQRSILADLAYIARKGYVVAACNYRLLNEAIFPTQIIDVKTAIRFLKAFSDQLNIDPDRIGTLGHSAGGHLAVLAATNYPFEKTDYAGYSDDVRCGVGMYSPLDIAAIIVDRKNDGPRPRREMPAKVYKEKRILKEPRKPSSDSGMNAENKLIGDDLSLCATASPVNTVNENSAPLLLINGDADRTVKLFNAEHMKKAMDEKGKECECYLVHGAVHSDPLFSQNEVLDIIAEFFDRHLREK
ncbi:MAG: alpha/beta hydrolase [Erysipelotrichaceae bacterium]|nr:alpha/beta hydrolase [Erysipelotrichaceae bacterium]